MMKKVGSEFKNKFHLLYTQESSEKIIWSSSDSSDYENYKENMEHRKQTPNCRKRKRRCSRNKQNKNIPNLDVVYAEDKQKVQSIINTTKSTTKINPTPSTSPIVSKPRICTKDLQKSPIVSIPQEFKSHQSIKSPILKIKSTSPIQSPHVRKKLFVCKERPMTQIDQMHKVKEVQSDISIPPDSKLTHIKVKSDSSLGLVNERCVQNSRLVNEIPAIKNADLAKRIKSYFENHFNSQASSQNSISEYESTTQNTKTSDDIDIISLTDDNEKSNLEMISSKDSSMNLDDTKTFKLKKDGLAYRLNSLLKKQSASICMWQNEKFLASNSKFLIPKGDYTVFRIQNVQLKYGCYVSDVKDGDDNSYSVIINSLHVNNVNLKTDALLKLYKPYDCLTIDNCNIIVNVFKFECNNTVIDKLNKM